MKRVSWLALCAALSCDDVPKVGEKCEAAREDQLVACESDAVALRCRNQWLEAVGCKGPEGCTGAGVCDRSLAAEGDGCWEDSNREAACTKDGRTLRCTDGHFVAVRACRGPKGCTTVAGEASCDQSLAKVGDRCRTGGSDEACSVDKQSVLRCTRVPDRKDALGGEFVVDRECPTAKGCELETGANPEHAGARCDFRGSKLGDRCGRGNGRVRVCSPDRSAVLRCDADAMNFVVDEACPRGKHCAPLDPKIASSSVACVPTVD